MTSDEDSRNRFIDELIGTAHLLESIESAAIAEAWASGAVAEWLELGGSAGQLGKRIAEVEPFGAALIGWMEGGEAPQSGAPWVADIGAHELERAVRLLQKSDLGEIGWILEYVAPSGDRHDLSATILEGELIGLAIGPKGLAEGAQGDASHGLLVDVVDRAEAIDAIRASLAGPTRALSEAGEATLPLLIRRVGGLSTPPPNARTLVRHLHARDQDDDRYAADVVGSSLRAQIALEAPQAVHEAHAAFIELCESNDPDARTLFDVAGVDRSSVLDLERFLRLVGAYLAPVDLGAHTDAQFEALSELEPADWVGVVLGMSRCAVGTPIDGDALVTFINRASEITTTIPSADAARISWAFEQMLFSWQVTGVLDAEGAVGEAARWLLPHAALAAWSRG